jgi:uncharacterized protein YodC (DUF2158 family)
MTDPGKKQRGPFAEGTLVCLKTGGPLMTVEDIRFDGFVGTVWFQDGICHRDSFHPVHLNAFEPLPLRLGASMFEAAYGPDRSKWPAPAPAPLGKQPVAFRVRGPRDEWVLVKSEDAAARAAFEGGTEYQGLYVRDGT